MTILELKKLKKSLPPEAIKMIAIKVTKSEDYVRKVLRGDRSDESIIDNAIELAAQHKRAEKRRSELINSL